MSSIEAPEQLDDDGRRRLLDKSWLKLSDRDEMFSPLNKMTEDELKDYNLKMYPPRKK